MLGRIEEAFDERARVRGPAAPVRRRRVPRAAHAGHHHPRLRRAVPRRRPRPERRARRGHAPHRAGGDPHGRRSSTTCSSWPASTRAGRSSARRSTSAGSPRDAVARRPRRRARPPGRPSSTGRRRGRARRRRPPAPGGGQPRRQRAGAHAAGDADRGPRRAGTGGPRPSLEVADDGPGMAPEVAARAFERFYRADPARSRHQGGSGLGLAIVQATVAAHGGTVALRPPPGGHDGAGRAAVGVDQAARR